MPELPEVETVRRELEDELKGKRVDEVEVRFGGKLNVPAKTFAKTVSGAAFKSFGRRAKLLLVNLSNGWTIVTHLKMTGRYLIKPKGAVPGKHDHVVFRLADGRKLFFQDIRKFGYLKLIRTADLEKEIFAKAGYGPEPLEPSFTFAKFKMCLTGSPNKKIKPLLLDQGCIAGIGNIYGDEACWYGKVQPTRKVGTLSETELRGIYKGAVKSMRDSLARRGTSSGDFMDIYGNPGGNAPHLKTYSREGQKCPRKDGGIIKKIWIGARSAHFCPKCQK